MRRKSVVLKFGGTSVQNEEALRNVAGIVKAYTPGETVVVTSALGGITNQLIVLLDAAAAEDQERVEASLQEIVQRHVGLLDAFVLSDQERRPFQEELHARLAALQERGRVLTAHEAASAAVRDEVVAYGELLSSLILTAALRSHGIPAGWFDVRKTMRTDNTHCHARPAEAETREAAAEHLQPLLDRGLIPVTQGFIGSAPDGSTTTLGRGGSDYSAALLGAALDAARIEIWTDVNGIMTADPRMVPAARKLDHLSFAEAAELAYFGAKVLHPATLLPAMIQNIPVYVRNTYNPEDPGTEITQHGHENGGMVVQSIAGKKGITVINVNSTRMLMAHGFLARVFEIFDRFETSVDLVSTSEVSVSMTIDNATHLEAICKALQAVGSVQVYRDVAIVCLVGQQMRNTPGIAGRVFSTVAPVNVLMISQGASELNLSFIIEDEDLPHVVRKLHAEFIEQPVNGHTALSQKPESSAV